MEISSSLSPYGQSTYSPGQITRCDCGACPLCRRQSRAESAENTSQKGGKELSSDQEKEVKDLKKRDREVRAHEQAHSAAGGQHVRGGPSYEFQTGPDGQKYAVGGEVSIDTSPVSGDPQATIRKMMIVRKAALAPAQPSGTDRSVAAAAMQQMNKARQELTANRGAQPNEDQGAPPTDSKDSAHSAGYTPRATSEQPDTPAGTLLNLLA